MSWFSSALKVHTIFILFTKYVYSNSKKYVIIYYIRLSDTNYRTLILIIIVF